MKRLMIALTLLTAPTMTTAQEPANPIRDVCQGEPLACIVAAVPLSLVAGAVVLSAAGEAFEASCNAREGQVYVGPDDRRNTTGTTWQWQCLGWTRTSG